MTVSKQSLYGQTAIIRGIVTDKQSGITLIGATVALVPDTDVERSEFIYTFQGARASLNMLAGEGTKEQKTGAIAGRGGVFEIKNVKPGNYVLIVRYIGYKKSTQTIRIEADKVYEIPQQLIQDLQSTQEVIVTGVASRTAKATSEVAVGRVDMAALTEKVHFSNPFQGLIGKVPGLFMQFSNGAVGSGVRINVRSSASILGGQPVIFIDGVRSNGIDYHTYPALQFDEISPLALVAPDDIETIDVLKGPVASSLYGTSGQNGVIMISTKRGKAVSLTTEPNPFRINYRFSGGYQEASRLFNEEMTLNAANANRLFRTGEMFQHQLSLQGGIGGIFNYYASLIHRNEIGILPGSDMRNTSARVNLDVYPISGLQAKFSMFVSDGLFDIPVQNENGGIFSGWLRNTLGGNPNSGLRFFDLDSASINAIQNNIDALQFQGSLDISYIPAAVPGLRMRLLGGMEEINSRAVYYTPPGFLYSINPNAPPSTGYRLIKNFSPFRVNLDANISYSREWIKDLNGTFIMGVQAFDNRFLLQYTSASDFVSPFIPAIQTGRASQSTAEVDERFREVGIFSRAELNYKETFFLSGGVRNDYASTLGRLAPNIFYPQGSFAIRLDKLGLPPEINLFKLRGGYGESGKLPGLRQSTRFWKVFFGPGNTFTGSSGYQLFLETPAGNPAIRPERIQEMELGADIEINDSYGAEITGFYQLSRDAIFDAASPVSTGLGTTAVNSGRMRGWGAEAQVYGRVINTQDVSLMLNLTGAFADNIVDSLGVGEIFQSERSFFGGPGLLGPTNYLHKGYRRGLFMDRPPIAPRFRENGYYDWDRGPVVDSILRPLGSSVPLFTGAFSWTLTIFRDFTFYGLIDAGLGRYIFNSTRQRAAADAANPRFNELATRLGLAEGQTGDIRLGISPVQGVKQVQPMTDEYRKLSEEFMLLDTRFGTVANYLERADWVRLRELSLRWNAANTLHSLDPTSNTFRQLSLGISVRNAFLWTTYSGPDTEINSPANIPSRSYAQASDIWSLMQSRTVNFHLEIGF